MMEKRAQWGKLVEPIVNRCNLAVKINQGMHFNTKGSDALSKLLTHMAWRLDCIMSMEESDKATDELEKKVKAHSD